MKTILLLGKNGQVGWELIRTLAPLGKVVACDKKSCDLESPDAIRAAIRGSAPQIIVNAAAYTAVDAAETDQERVMAINAAAPGIIAEEAKRLNSLFVHYSTDYVFDGKSPEPYQENDDPRPLNLYGKSKLAGEKIIEEINGKSLIIRTSWVYSLRGKNFLLKMLELSKEKKTLRIVDDQIGAPTWSRCIAEGTSLFLMKCLANPQTEWKGIYHMTCGGQISWYGFAKAIFEKSGKDDMELIPIPTSQYPAPAARPKNSLLSNKKLLDACGIALPSWEKALAFCLQDPS